jgi:hypothetical protein
MNLIWPHPLTLSPIGLGVGRAVLLAALWLSATGLAQTPAEIYRCGNAYTNQPVAGADRAAVRVHPVRPDVHRREAGRVARVAAHRRERACVGWPGREAVADRGAAQASLLIFPRGADDFLCS